MAAPAKQQSPILAEWEVRELTGGKVQHAAQRRELDALGVPYRERLDGSLAVSRVAMEAALGAESRVRREPQLRV